jgi:hypothetical protein
MYLELYAFLDLSVRDYTQFLFVVPELSWPFCRHIPHVHVLARVRPDRRKISIQISLATLAYYLFAAKIGIKFYTHKYFTNNLALINQKRKLTWGYSPHTEHILEMNYRLAAMQF